MKNVYGIIVSILYIGILFISASVFEKAGKEASRKYLHIMLSNWWIIAILFFDNAIWASVMPAIFVVINYISYKKDIIKVMERDEGDENKDSPGTVYYAISLLILAIISFGIAKNPLIGLTGIIVMGYGDGMAAVIGQGIKSKEFHIAGKKKTVAGTVAMFTVTLMIMIGFSTYVGATHGVIKAVTIAVLATIAEAVSIKGTDNLTVPLLTSLLTFLMM